jgi:hypothetical protein
VLPSVHPRCDDTRGEHAVLAEVRLIRLKQPLDDFAADEVLVDDLGDVVDGDVPVPDLLGVDDDADPVLALVEAAGVVRADDLTEPSRLQLCLQPIANLGAAAGLAAALGIVGGTLVDADEHVALKARHARSGYHVHGPNFWPLPCRPPHDPSCSVLSAMAPTPSSQRASTCYRLSWERSQLDMGPVPGPRVFRFEAMSLNDALNVKDRPPR